MAEAAKGHAAPAAGSGHTIRRSVLFSAMDRYVAQLLQILTTAVMARLLTPAETGLFLVAQAVILLADNFRTFGVGTYLVQSRELRHDMVRSAFTVTLILSLAMGCTIFLGSGRIADFYGQPELAGLLAVATLNFLLLPFASPAIALLQRELAFNALALINISAAAANAAVTIGFGLAGFGAVSFIWGFIAQGLVQAILAIRLKPDFSIFRPSLAGARSLMSFGMISTMVTVVNMAYELLPRLALGKLLGFGAVGLYSRALTTCQLPDRAIIQALQPVVLPAMADRARQGGSLRDAYLRGHTLVSAIQWPALAMLALLADPVVRILLGSQWDAVPPLVRMMALAMMALAPAFMTYPVLVASGRIRDTLTSSLISLPPSVAIVIAAATHSLQAVAASMAVTAPLQMLVALWFVRRAIGVTWGDLWQASWRSLVITLCTAALPGLIIATSPHGFDLDWGRTAAAVAAGALGWGAGLTLLRHPIGSEFGTVYRLLRAR